jgi:hypothetical protein
MNTEAVDTLDWHSTSTNTDRITPTIAGWYMCVGSGTYNATISARVIFQIAKNGTEIVKFDWAGGAIANGALVSQIVYLNGSTDYVAFGTYQFSGVNQSLSSGSLQVVLLRAA